MKTFVFSLLFIFALQDLSFAQQKMGKPNSKAASENCIGTSQNPLPYSPRFGTIHDTAAEVKKWGFGYYNEAYSVWSFQAISASETTLAPHFQGASSTLPIPIPLFFPCFQMESSQTYRLDFTYVGLAAGKLNNIRVVATQLTNGRYDEQNMITLGNLHNLASGSSEQNLVIRNHNLSGNYHLGLICDNFGNNNTFYLKNIRLTELSTYDLSLLGFDSPLSQCEINNQRIRLSLQNFGSTTPASYRICYTYNDGEKNSTPVCESFTQAIPLNEKATLTFSTPINVGASSQASFRAWIDNTYPDGNTKNDSLSNHIVRIFDPINPPYLCDFSSAENQRQWTSASPNINASHGWEMDIQNTNGSAFLHTDRGAADHWMISTCVHLKKDSLYRVRIHYQSLGSFPENLKIKVGRDASPSKLSILLQEINGFSHTQVQVLDAYYTAPDNDKFFFGLHALNPLPGNGIRIQKIEITSVAPHSLPLYRGFESFEDGSQWMAISKTHRNWTDTTDKWQGNVGLKSSTNVADSNFLCSPPIYLEANKTYEIVYARKANSNSREYLNLLLGQNHLLSDLRNHAVLLRDTLPMQTTWNARTVYFRVKQSGTYFLAFQYAGGTKGIVLDEIDVRDSITGSKNNLSVLQLEIPKPSCQLGRNERVKLSIKNHSSSTVPGSSVAITVEVNGKALSPIPTNNISAFQIITREISNVDLSKDTMYTIRAWITCASDQRSVDDTSLRQQSERIKPTTGLMQSSFENDADNRRWTVTSEGSGNYISWTFPSLPNSAYNGKKVAYLANPQVVNTSLDYLISPCINLSADTTYLIAFYYKTAEANKSSKLSLVVGSNLANLPSVGLSATVDNNSYRRLVRHYRPAYSETLYVGIRAESQPFSGGVIIDDFVILDSVNASIPQLALKEIVSSSAISCDLAADTLGVVLKNNGFFDYAEPKIKILLSDGRVIHETLTGIIPQGKESSFVVQTLWQHLKWGKDSVRIVLDIANDTSAFLYTEKHPAANTPYRVDFQNPEIYKTWNIANTSERAPFGGDRCKMFSLGNGKASFTNGNPEAHHGLLLSHCFNLNATEGPFRVEFSYRTKNQIQTEKLEVYLLHSNGQKERIDTLNSFSNVTFQHYSIPLTAKPTGSYKIAFYSPFNVLGKGIEISQFAVSTDSSRWPADIRVKRIILPSSTLNPSTSENISVVIENINKKPLHNIVVTLMHQQHIYTETITTLRAGDSLRYTFVQTLDLSHEGNHPITVFTSVADDINRLNDTIRAVFTSQFAVDLSIEDILLPTTAIDQLGATENITVVVKNKNKKTLENAQVFLQIDQGQIRQVPIQTLSQNDTAHCRFTGLDFSAEKTYNLLAYVALSNDIDRSNDTARKQLTHTSTAIKEQLEEVAIKIYPNPANQRVYIESSIVITNIELFNVAGQSLERTSLLAKNTSLDLGRHKPGLYFLRITTSQGSYTKSLVIKGE